MEIFYNELSVKPTVKNAEIANQMVDGFAKAIIEMKKNGIKKVRFCNQLHETEILEGYTLKDWLEASGRRALKDTLLSVFAHPFIPGSGDPADDIYITYDFFFEDLPHSVERTKCEGLAAAHIYDTLAISLQNDASRQRTLSVSKELNGSVSKVEVTNVYSDVCLEDGIVKDFISRNGNVELIESEIDPMTKRIHLREDHGYDILMAFADKVKKSPYVVSVINSLPFNPNAINLIRRVHATGIIEMVLYWEDKGYGIVVQTTGRNYVETLAISEILKEKYDN